MSCTGLVKHNSNWRCYQRLFDPSPGAIYRAHMFTSSGTFVVSDTTSDYGSNVEYLVVAGGAGGNIGGGAGGFRTNMTKVPC